MSIAPFASERVAATVSPARLAMSLGDQADITVTVRNRGAVVDVLELQVEGLEATWFYLPGGAVSLFPGDEGELQLKVQLPDDRTVEAGTRHARLHVFSRHEAAVARTLDFTLEILPVGGVEVHLTPTLVHTRGSAVYTLAVVNLGNSEQLVDLTLADRNEALEWRLDLDRIAVPPLSSEAVGLRVRPHRRPLIAAPHRYQFVITAVPAGQTIADPLSTAEGAIEYHAPLVWLAGIVPHIRQVLILLVVVGILFAALSWIVGTPGRRAPTPPPIPTRAPIVLNLPTGDDASGGAAAGAPGGAAGGSAASGNAASSGGASAGGGSAAGASGGASGSSGGGGGASPAGGSAAGGGASAGAGGASGGASGGVSGAAGTTAGGGAAGQGDGASGPPPDIQQFEVQIPPDAKTGEVELVWEVDGADEVEVMGTPQPASGSTRVENVADGEVQLTAKNAGGESTQTIGIAILRTPEVDEFKADRDTVAPGQTVRLSWTLKRASRATITGPGLTPDGSVVDPKTGTLDVKPDQNGVFTLVAQNDVGRVESQVQIRTQPGR